MTTVTPRPARRRLLGGLAAAAAAALAAPPAVLAGKTSRGYRVDAAATQICATCVFWGGVRRVSADRSEVVVETLGYCNNPDSPRYREQTSPDSGPMQAWAKWPALG